MQNEMYVEVKEAFLTKESKSKGRKRVAAYCRVSTDEAEQLTSYATQIAAYTERIMKNPQWEMVGIFADEGITGTSTKKRDEFNKLMELCNLGKVDIILTKSISRFARNTLDTLTYVRELKARGISVIFEKENINTATMSSEMILTLMSAFAQAESESISANVAWGIRQSFKKGEVKINYDKLLGYASPKEGESSPKITEPGASTVRRIYTDYLKGLSMAAIKDLLTKENIPNASGEVSWSAGTIKCILTNEKYAGDVIRQKTYIEDCISKKVKVNNGELPKYYIRNHHPAIIEREIFNKVQEEMAKRNRKRKSSQKAITEQGKYSGKYAMSEMLYCKHCGSRYRRVTWSIHGKKKIVWRCISRLDYGTKYCADSPSIEEEKLQEAILRAINKMSLKKGLIKDTLKENISDALTSNSNSADIGNLRSKIKELEEDIKALIRVNRDSDRFDGQIKLINEELQKNKALLARYEAEKKTDEENAKKLEAIYAALDKEDFELNEYDDITVRRLIEEVTVEDKNTITVIFKDGTEVKENLR